MPTWGPETEEVKDQIGMSGPSGDIVSWDTTDPDETEHRYIRRGQDCGRDYFYVMTYAEWMDR